MNQLTIYCHRSGTPMISAQLLTTRAWPMVQSMILLHPIYDTSSTTLLNRLDQIVRTGEWYNEAIQEAKLLMSAIMWKMESIIQRQPSLPADNVTVGCAEHLLNIFTFVISRSKPIVLPTYVVTKDNSNWHNFPTYLAAIDQLIEDYNSKIRLTTTAEDQILEDATDEAERAVELNRIYKKLDLKKVWSWIALQLDGQMLTQNLDSYRELFLNGTNNPTNYVVDDIDDLVTDILKYCDSGNEITFFIHKRLNTLREIVVDFYSGFTIISSSSKESNVSYDSSLLETPEETLLYQKLDNKLLELGTLTEPVRSNFANNILYMRAMAEYRLLSKRQGTVVNRAENNI